MADGIGYLTPDYDGNAIVECLTLALPSYLWRFVHGALGELTETSNWVQAGDLLPGDMVAIFLDALDSMKPCHMIGQIVMFATTELPDNVLPCDGGTFDVDEFPLLYGVLQTNILPDMRGRFPLSSGGNYGVGDMGGEEDHILTVAEMPAHTHGYTTSLPSVSTVVVPDEPSAVPSASVTSPEGGNQPHNNMPPYYVLIYAIVAK